MLKKVAYHPNALLSTKRNIRLGLVARTKIVLALEKGVLNTKTIVEETRLTYYSVKYHLHLLKTERIISHRGKPRSWELTGVGQQKLG